MGFFKFSFITFLTVLCLSACTTSKSVSKYTDADLVWSDDFNGTELNTNDWNYEFHEPGWVNNELQSYDDSKENTYVKDGFLIIQPLRKQNADGTFSYTSGRISTQKKRAFTYGRFEARLKVPKGQGYLPAFWMMPDDESFYGQWPKCGEIDIMEVLGHETDTVYGTIHFGEPHSQDQGTYTLASSSFADEFHVFAVEWEPGVIRYYCDGNLYKTMNDWYTKRPGFGEVTYPAPFDQPFYMILNVAVGGNWPGYPDQTTTFDEKAQLLVDYVKVYQKKSYDENVEKPKKAAVIDSPAGNMIKASKEKWTFLTAQGGEGSLSVEDGKIEIAPTADGPVEYAVQLVQGPLPMINGNVYRYSFDASADEERTLVTAITAPEVGWIRYFADTKISLAKEKKHFTWDFTMSAESDANARVEFNLGSQGSLAKVYIENVTLEKIGTADLSSSEVKILPDGNIIRNGQFQEGKGRLAFWEVESADEPKVFVTNAKGVRELKITGPAKVSQKDLVVPGKKEYILSFDGHASADCSIEVNVGKMKEKVALTSSKKHYEFVYMDDKTSKCDLDFVSSLDNTDVYIDNVFFKENAILLNGDFSNGMAAWDLYCNESADASVNTSSGSATISVLKTGNLDWMIQLKQGNISLEKGKTYKVEFEAMSDISRTIMWALQRDGSGDNNWIPYSDTQKIQVWNAKKTYSHTFTMESESDSAVIFTISLGAVDDKVINEGHRVVISNVSVEEVK